MPDAPSTPDPSGPWFSRLRPVVDDDTVLDSLLGDITGRLGFGTAAVLLLREDIEEMEYVAVRGSAHARSRLGRHVSLERVLAQLGESEMLGVVRYLPAERRVAGGFLEGLVPRSAPGAWHPDDLLVAVVKDEDRLRGLILLDEPRNRAVPSDALQATFHDWTRDHAPLVLAADSRRRLDHEVRLSRMSAEVLRLSNAAFGSSADLLQACLEVLRLALGGAVAWSHLLADDTWRRVTDEDVVVPDGVNRDVGRLLLPAVQRLLEIEATAVFAGDRLAGPREVVEPLAALVGPWLEQEGHPQLMVLPLGAGSELLGFAVLAKRAEAPQWTDLEIAAARQVAGDLGVAVRNRQFEEQRTAMSELKRTFVATLVHELKNPVTSIKAHSELLESLVAGSEAGLRSVRALQRAGDQFERTVRDLLLFARYDDASVALDLAPVRLGEVLTESVELFVAEAESRQVSLVADVSLGEDVVEADRTAMERLVNNLVGNAVKYTDAGGVVSVVLRESDQDDWGARGLALEVADTGIGIGEDDLAHLFREFYRSSDPSARSRPGTGLGLAVVQRIVQRHGGQIEVVSEVGQGTTVTVLLPGSGTGSGSTGRLAGVAGDPAVG